MLLAFHMGRQMVVLMTEQAWIVLLMGTVILMKLGPVWPVGSFKLQKELVLQAKISLNFLPVLILSVVVRQPCVGVECLAVHCCVVEDAAYSLTPRRRCLPSCMWSPRIYSHHSVMCHHIACWTLAKWLASKEAPVRATSPLLWDSHA